MRIFIIANGKLTRPVRIEREHILIAADGGALHCRELDLTPNYVIGDLDSLAESELARLSELGAQIIQYPTRKDFTDLELAMQLALELGADEIVIYAALGDRWDQTIANLLLAGAYPSARIRLVDANQEIFYIRAGETITIDGCPGDTVSLIPLVGDAAGISTQGLEYALEDETLRFGSTRGVSNVMLDSIASVSLRTGLLLCALIHTETDCFVPRNDMINPGEIGGLLR